MSERPAKALEGLFYERFFYNDLISSHDDPQLTAANLMAILAFPGLLTLYWVPKYYVVLARAPEYVRQWHALGDRFLWIAYSMTVLGLLAALQWESLLPDRRDMTILGPQPVSAVQLFRAQAKALGRYLGLFFLMINVCALLFYPLGAVPWKAGLLEGVWFTIANTISVVAASAFAFLAVAGIQSLLLLALPSSVFRRVSQWAQFVVAAALCGALILLFALRTLLRSPLHRLRLGTFAGIGMAFVVIRTWAADLETPTRALLEGPFALLFLAAVGLRGAYQLPAELPANWAFRFHTDGSRLQRYLTGARKAAWLAAPVPLILISAAVAARLWGAAVAIPHAATMAMAAWLILEAAGAGVYKIPFTCNFVAPRAHIIIVWTMGAAAMLTFAAMLASLELWALENVWRLWQAAAWAAAAGVIWLWWNERLLAERGGPEFFEQPDEIQRLGLDR